MGSSASLGPRHTGLLHEDRANRAGVQRGLTLPRGPAPMRHNQGGPVSISLPAAVVSAAASVALVASSLITATGAAAAGAEPNSASATSGNSAASVTPRSTEAATNPRWLSSSSGGTSCAVLNTGGITCWGADENITAGATSVQGAIAVSVGADIGLGFYAGFDVACAVLDTGGATCWGDNSAANSGAGNLRDVLDVEVGGAGACFVLGSGTVTCFQNPRYGIDIPRVNDATKVAVGTYAICVLRRGGQVDCSGSDWLGHVSGPESVSGVVDVSVGDHHACVLTSSGGVSCWGISTQGVPASGVRQISVGATGGCATLTTGGVSCWGQSSAYRVGIPSGLTSPVSLAAGWVHVCALRDDGTVACWSGGSEPVVAQASQVANVRTTQGQVTPPPPPTGPGDWSISGSVQIPTRTGSTLTFSGDITAPVRSTPNERRSLGVRVRSTGVVHFLSPATDINPGTTYYEGSLDVTPLRGAGDLDLVIANYRSAPGVTSVIAIDLAEPFSIPGVASRTNVTQASASELVLGESIDVSVVTKVLWTDGVTTDDTPTGNFRLQFRATGTAAWETVGSGAPRISVKPRGPGDYRFLVGDQTTPAAYVNVIRPTTAFRISDWAANATSAFAGNTLIFTALVDNQYDDANWRPAIVGTPFEVQFLADGAGSWQRVVRDTVKVAGRAEVRWPMVTSGRFRLIVGGAISNAIPITLVVPTSVVALDVLDLPVEVEPGEPVDISVGVEIQYSDGEFRSAPDGTEYKIEFAEAEEPITRGITSPRAELTWKTVARGKTLNGQANSSVRPEVSGYWRVSVGRAVTEPVYVAVPGGVSAGAPGAVMNVVVGKARKGKVTVSWRAPVSGSGPFTYQVRTSANGVTWTSWRDIGDVTRVTINVKGKKGQKYIKIRAINSRATGREVQFSL